MKRSFAIVCLVLTLLLPARGAETNRFENEIKHFEALDKKNPPPQNAILFVGSSMIRKWTSLTRDFPKHQVINRGFGGSYISDSVYFFDRIVKPYHPKVIVFYAGSNDINAGKKPEVVLHDLEEFREKIHQELPEAQFDFISIGTSPSRWKDA
jgi:hypothetical protein